MRTRIQYYKCVDCGCSFTESEKDYIIEDCGECFGIPSQERIPVCPHCHSSDIADAKECIRCGEVHTEEEMSGELCNGCKKELIEKYRRDIGVCLHIFSGDCVTVKIPRYCAEALGEDGVAELIANYFHARPEFDAIDYIEEDEDWFCELAADYEGEVI